jgi:hypothetical protein
MDGHTTVTKIRACSDSSDVEQPVTSVAFLSGTFFINSDSQSAHLDTTSVKHICNWPYVDTDPAFFDTSIDSVLKLPVLYADCRTNFTMNRSFSPSKFLFTSSMTSNRFG